MLLGRLKRAENLRWAGFIQTVKVSQGMPVTGNQNNKSNERA